ncbi:iron-containing alcohol dehydrogenase [Pseudodesulfovibrio senegalensis]|uniref:Iron-containing alcohol dehydrogenase n=1 Tax=Pseudodesulfovibrio senegalensis TaxID=1721087 RepID=A0A6N6N601_9BACT|nr:iron-containing alcohol dehydrogenase [Pseudodesulfovibrio senegalensis]KAB1443670.1 iron-containing alcohol dehydrogenase [Pseudodesulfovibrio senegalensis]
MLHFNHYMPTRIIFGPGELKQLGTHEALPGRTKAMIVIGESGIMLQNGYLARTQGFLSEHGIQSLVFDRIKPNPESDSIAEAATICKEKEIDLVVGLGGGSTLDAAKAIALMAANDGDLWDYVAAGTGKNKKPNNPALPMVAIPTTAGTGSEVTPSAVITKSGGNEKIGIRHESMYPIMAVVDPDLMLSMPPFLTACTGMDAYFHAVESYLSTVRSPNADLLALETIHLICHYLPRAVADGEDMEARIALAWASTAAGISLSQAVAISQHSMEHALSGFYPELPHGAGLTMLSNAYFSFLAEQGVERIEDLAMAMADALEVDIPEDQLMDAFIPMLEELIRAVGLAELNLSDYGMKPEDIPALADNALDTMGRLFEISPVKMTREDVITIFEAAYS